ncbi:MAG: cysteine peptidase family C39 domain-containing protein, partial [Bryobacteraceae bacterium]
MRRWLAPEVIQTSAMDCGPAALKCVLEGFGIRASYGRLREACQTDVDGTSIDTIEDTAVRLGLDASQITLPLDQLLAAESNALPAIIVVRLANGGTHFVVIWRKHGPFLQIMDPAHGRRWVHRSRFLSQVYVHSTTVPPDAWQEWSSGESFQSGLRNRLKRLRVPDRDALLASDPAALDAAIRLASALHRTRAISRGASAGRLIASLVESPDQIPIAYWSAKPLDEEAVAVRGAVLLHIEGVKPASER